MIGIAENGWKYGWVDGLSIYIAVIIIVTVTSGNNYIKEL
jgi:Ca2+ transporting ATPase